MVEVEELRTKITDMEITIADQAQEIDELTSQITALRSRLDVERRYLSDITPYHFKSWLKKQAPSPFVSRMVADPLFPAHGPRSLYEAHVRRLHCSEEEHDDFVRLWKLMLLQA